VLRKGIAMNIFKPAEILQFAVRIEENGEKFYRQAAQATKDEEAKYIFNDLAAEETKHKEIFKGFLAKADELNPKETYTGEYFDYLKEYIDNKIIFARELDKPVADVKDTLSALSFAMQRELDSILYYHEVKKFVADRQHALVDKIIQEEWKHYSRLSAIRNTYAKKV